MVTVFLTGQGAVAPAVSTGEPAPGATPARAVFPVTATLGNRKTTVTFAGLSPDSAGLFQINFIVPGVGPGSHPLVVTVNGVSSNPRSVSVSGKRSADDCWGLTDAASVGYLPRRLMFGWCFLLLRDAFVSKPQPETGTYGVRCTGICGGLGLL